MQQKVRFYIFSFAPWHRVMSQIGVRLASSLILPLSTPPTDAPAQKKNGSTNIQQHQCEDQDVEMSRQLDVPCCYPCRSHVNIIRHWRKKKSSSKRKAEHAYSPAVLAETSEEARKQRNLTRLNKRDHSTHERHNKMKQILTALKQNLHITQSSEPVTFCSHKLTE